MEPSYNFDLSTSKLLSKSCIALGLTDFISVCNYVKQLPYGRNNNRANYTSILQENKGTCSTKHAFLKEIAMENEADHMLFYLCIYKMKETNTVGIGEILANYNLAYIPEAHSYLKFQNKIIDCTRMEESQTSFKEAILLEEEILPKQIGEYKLAFHKGYIKNWIKDNNIPYSYSEIWNIREACISKLSK